MRSEITRDTSELWRRNPHLASVWATVTDVASESNQTWVNRILTVVTFIVETVILGREKTRDFVSLKWSLILVSLSLRENLTAAVDDSVSGLPLWVLSWIKKNFKKSLWFLLVYNFVFYDFKFQPPEAGFDSCFPNLLRASTKPNKNHYFPL